MVKAVFDNLTPTSPKNHFTVGINDDVTHTSLDLGRVLPARTTEGVHRAMFYGLGSDGTVGANKNSIKIIGDETDNYAQGYFVYDSKKAGAVHGLAPALRQEADPAALPDHEGRLRRLPQVQLPREVRHALARPSRAAPSCSTAPYGKDEVWEHLPEEVQKQIIDKKLKFYVIDAIEIAEEPGLGARINTIMQTAFFKISGVLPEDEAIELIKKAIEKTYGKQGRGRRRDEHRRRRPAARKAIERGEVPAKAARASST